MLVGSGVGRGVGDGTEVAVGAAATLTTGFAGSGLESDWFITAKTATPTAATAMPKETTATLVERGESSIFLIRSDKAIRACLSCFSSFRVTRDQRSSRLGRTSVYRVGIIHGRWMPSSFCVSKRGTRRAKRDAGGSQPRNNKNVGSFRETTLLNPLVFPLAHQGGGIRHPPLTSLRSFAPPCAEAKGAYVFPLLSFPASPCHSERSEESPPFAKRKGPGGCSQFNNCQRIPRSHRCARSRPLTQAKGAWVAENHGNHGSKPPPFAERKGARGMLAFARTSITTSNMWYQLLQTRFRR